MQSERYQGGVWARRGILAFIVPLAIGGGIAAVGGRAQAQAPASSAPSSASEDSSATTLESRLAQIARDLEALRAAVEQNNERIMQLKTGQDELAELRQQAEENLAILRLNQDTLTDLVQRMNQISEPDPYQNDSYVPAIYGAMEKSSYFSGQMDKAVHAAMRNGDRKCTLRIVNRTAASQMLQINDEGSWIRISPGQEIEQQFEFSAGSVVTRLAGQNPVTWFLGPPNYRQDVQIVIR